MYSTKYASCMYVWFTVFGRKLLERLFPGERREHNEEDVTEPAAVESEESGGLRPAELITAGSEPEKEPKVYTVSMPPETSDAFQTIRSGTP